MLVSSKHSIINLLTNRLKKSGTAAGVESSNSAPKSSTDMHSGTAADVRTNNSAPIPNSDQARDTPTGQAETDQLVDAFSDQFIDAFNCIKAKFTNAKDDSEKNFFRHTKRYLAQKSLNGSALGPDERKQLMKAVARFEANMELWRDESNDLDDCNFYEGINNNMLMQCKTDFRLTE